MMLSIVYGQKYITSDTFDQLLGKFGNFGEKINKKIGRKIFPENLEGRQVSFNKVVDSINTQFQVTALGLNLLSAASNYFGGNAQSIINSGKYFTKTDYIRNQMWILPGKMIGGDKKKYIAALEYFLPLNENYNKEIAKLLSVSNLTQEKIQDFLMILMRSSDLNVQTTNFYSFLDNSIIQDGQVVNAREYLRDTDEYKDMFAGTKEERKARGAKGREWALSDESGFTSEKMGENIIETLDELFATWKPREKYEFINLNEVKDRVINHKLLY